MNGRIVYDELNQTYIIFICTFDPFGQDRYAYTFRNICAEDTKIELADQTTKLFLNAKGSKGDVTEHTKAFLQYVNGLPTEDRFTKMIDEEVIRTKKEEKWRREYMTLEMELQKIKKEGIEQGRIETAIELMKEKFPLEKIAKITKLSVEKLNELGRVNGLL